MVYREVHQSLVLVPYLLLVVVTVAMVEITHPALVDRVDPVVVAVKVCLVVLPPIILVLVNKDFLEELDLQARQIMVAAVVVVGNRPVQMEHQQLVVMEA
tara:strand:- start:288 stop:587 length:300 start_codon:yes stop_codon:yes gene_type:complete